MMANLKILENVDDVDDFGDFIVILLTTSCRFCKGG